MGYGNIPGYGTPGYGGPGYGGPGYGPGPGGPGGPGYGSPPSSHLAWAILTTLFCCLPFGVVSIVFAAQVNSKWTVGDYAGAQAYSSKAKGWATASTICGVVVLVIYGIIFLATLHSSNTP